MSHDVHDLLQRTADEPTRPLDTAAVVGKVKRQTRLARVGAGLGAVAVVAGATLVALPMVTRDDPGLEIADQPDRTDQTDVLVERAPVAGSDASHWPVELVYRGPHEIGRSDDGHRLRFRGTSWAAWTIESNYSDDGPLPNGQWSEPGGPGLDASDTWVGDRSRWRGFSPELHAEWRSAVGLGERVVIEPADIPGGPALIASLGLTADEVEAYATPNVAGCGELLDRCAPDDPDAARGIAHLATGFPLFAEERYDGGPGTVWIIAESFTYGDAVSNSSTPGGPSADAPLPEGDWQLVAGTVDGDPIYPVADEPITLTTSGSRGFGWDSCNNYEMTVETTATGGVQAVRLDGEDAGCPVPEAQAAERYTSALMRFDWYELVEGELRLTGPNLELRFEEAGAQE